MALTIRKCQAPWLSDSMASAVKFGGCWVYKLLSLSLVRFAGTDVDGQSDRQSLDSAAAVSSVAVVLCWTMVPPGTTTPSVHHKLRCISHTKCPEIL